MKKRKIAPDHPTDIETASIQGGERVTSQDAPIFPIWQTATFTFRDFEDIARFNAGTSTKTKYGRYGNPLQKVCEAKLAVLEDSEGCLLFASGMNAITTAFLALTSAGDHVVYSSSLYRNSTRFFSEVLPRFGVATTCVPVDSVHDLKQALRPNTKVVFYEVPTNLFLRVADLQAVVKTCKASVVPPLVVIDSTFATPLCRGHWPIVPPWVSWTRN